MRNLAVSLSVTVVAGYYWFGRCFLITEASSAAGTETLVGIVGKDFVLLGADSSVSQSISLTASNLDKIAPLVDPFPEVYRGDGSDNNNNNNNQFQNPHRILQSQWHRRKRQQAIIAAAAGDAADSDRLLSYLKAIGSVEEYTNGGLGCDVRWVSLEDTDKDNDNDHDNGNGNDVDYDDVRLGSSGSRSKLLNNGGGLDVRSMSHLARRCIWEKMRSRTPYRICLLIAGMMLEDEFPLGSCAAEVDGKKTETDTRDDNITKKTTTDPRPKATANEVAFTSQKVQKQLQQAWKTSPQNCAETKPTTREETSFSSTSVVGPYRPHLYWLDEYGSLQKIQYGAHGHGSNFLLSILDQSYRPDLTREEAIQIMNECFQELRNRYVINSPEAPCIKCVDAHGIRWVPPSTSSDTAKV